jgi:hypothetical protein
MIIFLKGHVDEHQRHLKNGKVVLVRAHDRLTNPQSHEDIREAIGRHAEAMGLETDRHSSGISSSQYLTVTHRLNEDDSGKDYKIRISDHVLPPTYKMMNGEADYEVSVPGKEHQDTHGEWSDAIDFLSRRTGKPVPKTVQARIDRLKQEEADKQAMLRRYQEEAVARLNAGQAEKANMLAAAEKSSNPEVVDALHELNIILEELKDKNVTGNRRNKLNLRRDKRLLVIKELLSAQPMAKAIVFMKATAAEAAAVIRDIPKQKKIPMVLAPDAFTPTTLPAQPVYMLTFQGIDVAIENREGSVRSGVDPDGKPWQTRMLYPYGYVSRSEGADGDEVDCYVGPSQQAENVYVIHQRKAGKWTEYDEDKCMLGFDSIEDAKLAYMKHYNDPRFLGEVTTIPVAEFKRKVAATKKAPGMIKALVVFPAAQTATKK